MAEMKDGALEDRWQPVFRHSAGRLGSQHLTALREEKRLLAWKTTRPQRISSPPKDFGTDGTWIDIGPGATLLSVAPAAWVAETGDVPQGYLLSRIVVDGTDTPQLALLKAGDAAPKRGARLNLRFSDQPAETGRPAFWFEPAEAER